MSNENIVYKGRVDVYHQNLPGLSLAMAACVYAVTQLFIMCGLNANHTYHHSVHSDAAKHICEVPAGRDDPRCVGYFAR